MAILFIWNLWNATACQVHHNFSVWKTIIFPFVIECKIDLHHHSKCWWCYVVISWCSYHQLLHISCCDSTGFTILQLCVAWWKHSCHNYEFTTIVDYYGDMTLAWVKRSEKRPINPICSGKSHNQVCWLLSIYTFTAFTRHQLKKIFTSIRLTTQLKCT